MSVTFKQLRGVLGKVYRGLLTQAGTANPTANVFTNNLGAVTPLAWARTGVGTYTLTGPAGTFTVNKTLIKGMIYDQATGKCLTGVRTSDSVLTFKHGIAAGAASDVFTDVPFEVIVLE